MPSYLSNTLFKLKNAKTFTIGYFGGSITEGAGASDIMHSWQGITKTWFEENYPDAEIKSIQAAVGGTGSDLGVYRCDNDLLKYKPDLVFYEFAVNDSESGYERVLADTESIFKKILKSDPTTDIIVIYTTTKSISDNIASGHEYVSRSADSAAAHKFGLLQIDIGEVLRGKIAEAGGDWSKYTVDTVHPNNDGYKVYADCIIKTLSENLSHADNKLTPHNIPENGNYIHENACMISATDIISSFTAVRSWMTVNKSLCGRYQSYIESCGQGAEFVYEFVGARIGLYLMLASDSGDFVCSIDNGKERSFRTFDSFCLNYNRAGSIFVCDELEYGKHTLRIRVADTKDERSKGYVIRIGAFLIS